MSSLILVICFFRWFDEISVGLFLGWSKSNRKGRTRKKIVAKSIHFVGLTAGSQM